MGKGLPRGGPFCIVLQLPDRFAMVETKSTILDLSASPAKLSREATTSLRLPFAVIANGLAMLAWAIGADTPASSATVMATVTANNIKPLTLVKLQNLDFGTVTLGPGAWSGATVSLSQAGILTCGNTNIICSGATVVAQYNVQGSNQQTVRISAPNVTLVNQSDSTQTLTLVTDAPATIFLTNSGSPGINFSVGGSVTLNSTTAAGTYVGTFNVTVDY